MFPRLLSTSGCGIVLVTLALAPAGCSNDRAASATRSAPETQTASLSLSETPASTADPLPEGWVRLPDGSLRIPHEPSGAVLSAGFIEFSEHMSISSATITNDGRVVGFTVGATQTLEPGTYEASAIRVDRQGRVLEITPHNPAMTDCCWMTVEVRGTQTTYHCSGSCSTPGAVCNAKFALVEDSFDVWCECEVNDG